MLVRGSWALLSFVAVVVLGDDSSDLAELTDVVELTDTNFDKILSDQPMFLVAFVAPWCGHCKKLKPEYGTAATALKADGISLGMVDTVKETKLYWKYKIQGFPTIKMFRYGMEGDECPGRDSNEIVQFVQETAQKPQTGWRELKSATGAELLADIDPGEDVGAVIGFFKDLSEKTASRALMGAAISTKMKRIKFGATSTPELIEHYFPAAQYPKLKLPKMLLLKPHDEKRMEFTAKSTKSSSSIVSFVEENAWPLVIEFSQANKWMMFERRPGFQNHFIFFVDKTEPYFEDSLKAVNAAAAKYRGRAVFIWCDVKESANKDMIDELQVTESLPAVRLVVSDHKKQKISKYRFAGFTEEEEEEVSSSLKNTASTEKTLLKFLATYTKGGMLEMAEATANAQKAKASSAEL